MFELKIISAINYETIHVISFKTIHDLCERLNYIIDSLNGLNESSMVFISIIIQSEYYMMIFKFDILGNFYENNSCIASHKTKTFYKDGIFYITPYDYNLIINMKEKLKNSYDLIRIMELI